MKINQSKTKTSNKKISDTNNNNLLLKVEAKPKKENNLSYKESKQKTKTNKIYYIIPVIILSIIFLLGYLLYNLLKER